MLRTKSVFDHRIKHQSELRSLLWRKLTQELQYNSRNPINTWSEDYREARAYKHWLRSLAISRHNNVIRMAAVSCNSMTSKVSDFSLDRNHLNWPMRLYIHRSESKSYIFRPKDLTLRKYERYFKTLLVRGKKLWDMLPEKVQKATTKVKYVGHKWIRSKWPWLAWTTEL